MECFVLQNNNRAHIFELQHCDCDYVCTKLDALRGNMWISRGFAIGGNRD